MSSSRLRAGALRIVVALAALGTSAALAGCAASPKAPVSSGTPIVVESVEPAAASTPTPTPTPIPTGDSAASGGVSVEFATAERQKYLDMTLADFQALPDSEKATFVALTNVLYMEAYEKSWKREAKFQDQSIPDISKESDPQDIADFATWEQRIAYSLTGDEREKYLEAMLYQGTGSIRYHTFKQWSDEHPDRWNGAAAAQNNIAPLVQAVAAEVLSDNGDGTATRMITITGQNGTFPSTFHYNDVTLSDGTVVPLWRVD